jgi:hypothetical protein
MKRPLKITLKMTAWAIWAVLYFVFCTTLIAWLYRMAPVEDVSHWRSWQASNEMAAINTGLSALWWIWPLFLRRNLPLWVVGFGITVLSAFTNWCYVSLIFELGLFHPLLTVFGYSAVDLFTDDTGIVYVALVIPAVAILSGITCCTLLKLVGGKRREGPTSTALILY